MDAALLSAASTGDLDLASQILQDNASLAVRCKTSTHGHTPLMLAVLSSSTRVVNLLLTHKGVDQVPQQDKSGKTALHYAFRGGLGSTSQILLFYDSPDLKALRQKDGEGRTPCDEASECGHRALAVDLIGKRGAALPGRGEAPVLYRGEDTSLEVCWEAVESAPRGGRDPSSAPSVPPEDLAIQFYRLQAAQLSKGKESSAGAAAAASRPSAWVTITSTVPAKAGSFRVKGLAPGMGYIFRVAACNAFGWGEWSGKSDVMSTLPSKAGGGGGAEGNAMFWGAGGGGGGVTSPPPSNPPPAASPSLGSVPIATLRAMSSKSGGGGGGGGVPMGSPPVSTVKASLLGKSSPTPTPTLPTISPASSILAPRSKDAARVPPPSSSSSSLGDKELREDFLRSLQLDLDTQSTQRRTLEGVVARLTATPSALEELSVEGLGELEGELEASLRSVRAAKERRMREAIGDEQSRAICAVCLTLPKTTLFLPCKHLCACTDCANRIMALKPPLCPICRTPAQQVLDVYA